MITSGKSYWLEHERVRRDTYALGLDGHMFGPGVEAMGFQGEVLKLQEIKDLAEGVKLHHIQENRTQAFLMSFSLAKLQSVYISQLPPEKMTEELKAISKMAEKVVNDVYLKNLKNHEGVPLKCTALANAHIESSKGDMHVHIHIEIYNCGITKEGKYYSIRNAQPEIYQKQDMAKAMFALEVKHYLEKKHGLKVEKGDLTLGDKKLDDAVRREFSSVKEQVRDKIKELGRKPSPREHQQFLKEVHRANRVENPRAFGYLDVEKTQAVWKERAEKVGLKDIKQFVRKEVSQEKRTENAIKWDTFKIVNEAQKKIENKKFSYTKSDLMKASCKEAMMVPDSPTTKQLEAMIDSALRKEKTTKKEVEKAPFEETRFATKNSQERDEKRTWAMWRDALKGVAKDVKTYVKDKLKEARETAKNEDRQFSKKDFMKYELPKKMREDVINAKKNRHEENGKILVTLTAEQVPYFLMHYRKTPRADAHKRAGLEFMRTFSLDAAQREYKEARKPRDRLDSGVIVLVEDKKNQVSDVQKDLLRKLSKRDNCKIIVEAPIKAREEDRPKEKQNYTQKERGQSQ